MVVFTIAFGVFSLLYWRETGTCYRAQWSVDGTFGFLGHKSARATLALTLPFLSFFALPFALAFVKHIIIYFGCLLRLPSVFSLFFIGEKQEHAAARNGVSMDPSVFLDTKARARDPCPNSPLSLLLSFFARAFALAFVKHIIIYIDCFTIAFGVFSLLYWRETGRSCRAQWSVDGPFGLLGHKSARATLALTFPFSLLFAMPLRWLS